MESLSLRERFTQFNTQATALQPGPTRAFLKKCSNKQNKTARQCQMVFSMTDEVYVFLYSALSGGLIMLFYDILSIAGEKKECPVFLLNVCDGIFIIVACAIMVFVSFTVSNGIVRSFEFLGAILGAILYKLTLSRLISAFLKKITDAIAAFFKLFFK